jgi:hypothetical protein
MAPELNVQYYWITFLTGEDNTEDGDVRILENKKMDP